MADTCLYTKFDGKSEIILLLWVDNLIVGASDKITLDNFKEAVKSKFAIKELGALKSFLGIDFTCTKNQLTW